MFKVGDTVTLHGIEGKISEVHPDKRIGLHYENSREAKYSLVFEDIPESLLNPNKDDSRRESSKLSRRKKTKSSGRKD